MVYRYNSYIIKKISYRRMLIKIKIVELFKYYYYYLFYLLPNSVPFLGPCRLIPSIYRKNP